MLGAALFLALSSADSLLLFLLALDLTLLPLFLLLALGLLLLNFLLLAQILLPLLLALVSFRLHVSGVVLIRLVPGALLLGGRFVADFLAPDVAHGVENRGQVIRGQRIKGSLDGLVDIAAIHGTLDQGSGFPPLTRKKRGFAINFRFC